jgi:hypothetical protein
MTEKDAKLKLVGPHGPMVAAPDYPIEAVLKKLGIPYRVIDEKELAERWMQHQRENPVEYKIEPMQIPQGILDFLDFSYGKKTDE